VEDFNRAIELEPKNPMYYNNRGVAHLRRKDYDKALSDFDYAIKLDSGFASAYHNRGMAFSGKGRHDKAVEEFSKVIEINPDSPVLLKDRGLAYMKLNEYELALDDLEKSVALDKDFAPGHAALGLLRVLVPDSPIRNPSLGLRLAERAVALTKGSSPDMLQNLAEVQYALNRTDHAMDTLKKAMEMDPANDEYKQLLAKWGGPGPRDDLEVPKAGAAPFANLW
jgi:tetratricopeptide (TPR) repeat protein